jgi:hypothetical protein
VRQFVERVANGQVALDGDGHREVDAAGQANLTTNYSYNFVNNNLTYHKWQVNGR